MGVLLASLTSPIAALAWCGLAIVTEAARRAVFHTARSTQSPPPASSPQRSDGKTPPGAIARVLFAFFSGSVWAAGPAFAWLNHDDRSSILAAVWLAVLGAYVALYAHKTRLQFAASIAPIAIVAFWFAWSAGKYGWIWLTAAETACLAAIIAAGAVANIRRERESSDERLRQALVARFDANDAMARRFEFTLKALGGALWEVEPYSKTVECDFSATRLVGADLTFDGLLSGMPQVTVPEDIELVADAFRKAIFGRDQIDLTHRIVSSGGEVRSIRTVGFRTGAGRGARVVFVSIDETERRRLEARLADAQKTEALSRLTSGIAHDFNNILTAIVSSAETLQAAYPEDGAPTTIHRAASRAATLVAQLMAYSRSQTLAPRTTDANEIIAEVGALISQILRDDVRLDLSLEADLPTISVDPSQLMTAVLNLALNAQDAMPKGGSVQIATRTRHLPDAAALRPKRARASDDSGIAKRAVIIEVSDTGEGISAEILPRVFDPFFSTKSSSSNSGLGLSMVRGFIEQSGGSIEIRSAGDAGTTVTLTFHADESAPVAIAPVAAPEQPHAPRRIFLVEDDDLVRSALTLTLENMGHAVSSAGDGPTALRRIGQEPLPDIVITDIMLRGGMSGPALVSQLNRGDRSIKVLFISGHIDDNGDPTAHLPSGAAFLQKPFRADALSAAIERITAH